MEQNESPPSTPNITSEHTQIPETPVENQTETQDNDFESINEPINDTPKEVIVGTEISIEKIGEIFPKPNDPIENIRVTDIGLYSITKKNEAYFISNLITKYFGENKITITDSTACCGGNTISFLLHPQIQKVNSVEINDLHFEILVNNINLYKNSNKVHTYKGNYLFYAKSLEQDVIFYDLPWGGRQYIEKEDLILGLTSNDGTFVSLSTIINQMKDRAKLQVLKIPLNFAFSLFLKEIDYTKIKIHKIYNKFTKKLCYFILILIT